MREDKVQTDIFFNFNNDSCRIIYHGPSMNFNGFFFLTALKLLKLVCSGSVIILNSFALVF